MGYIQSKLSNNSIIVIDIDDTVFQEQNDFDNEYRDTKKTRKKILDSGRNLVGDAVKGIRECAHELAAGMDTIEKKLKPDEIETTLSFTLSAEAGAVLTKIGGEAHIEVKLIWKNLK